MIIAVVEDERALREDLAEYLSGCGYHVVACGSGPELDRAMDESKVDIVVLDINLPGEDGFSIAHRLRRNCGVGIVMLTARSVGVDRIVGLEVGADAYLVKPVEFRELEAQIKSLARRLRAPQASAPSDPTGGGDAWRFDRIGWHLECPDGIAVKLTATERVFVSLLAAQPSQPVSRAVIFQALGKRHWEAGDRSIDSMVRRLRAKVEAAAARPLPVEAVHAVGYVFTAPLAIR